MIYEARTTSERISDIELVTHLLKAVLRRVNLLFLVSDTLGFDLDLRLDLRHDLAELADLFLQLLELATLLQLLVSPRVHNIHVLLSRLNLLLKSTLRLLLSRNLLLCGGDFRLLRGRSVPSILPLPSAKVSRHTSSCFATGLLRSAAALPRSVS